MNTEIVCPHCSTPNPATEPFCENCGAALNQPALPLLNQRYRILHLLGKGGQGTVYKVQDTQFNDRLLAIKKLDLPSVAPKYHKSSIQGFEQEATILSSLKHPNLPHIYEHFIDNGDYYLVMDFIEGETLSKYLESRNSLALSPIEAVLISIQLTTVLEYLHTRQPTVIFRDLKPDNVIITREGTIYLIDFGIARHFKPGQTKDTVLWITPVYAAPEQCQGQQTSVSSDIYSLGVVLYELLTGDDLADPSFYFAPLTKQIPALRCLIESMIMDDPQDRPASAAIVKQQLQQILQDLQHSTYANQARSQTATKSAPLTRVLPTPHVQMPRGEPLHACTHHSGAIYALAWSPGGKLLASAGEDCQACVSEASTGKAIFTYQQQHTASVRALAWSPDNRYVASASNDRTVQIWQAQDGRTLLTYLEHRRWVQALSWSSDGTMIVSGDTSGQIYLWHPRTAQRQASYRQHKTSSISALSFSPDSTLIASGDEDGAIHVWESRSLAWQVTYAGHLKGINALAWSPDGTYIASSSEDRKDHALHIWRATTGAQVATYAAHERMVNALAWSPDGKLLASAGQDQTVQLLDAQTGDILFTYRDHTSSVNVLAWSPDGTLLASASADGMVRVWWAK